MQGYGEIRGELLALILVLKMGLNGILGCMSVVSRKTLFSGHCVDCVFVRLWRLFCGRRHTVEVAQLTKKARRVAIVRRNMSYSLALCRMMSLQHRFRMRRTTNDLNFHSTKSLESLDDGCLLHAKRHTLQVGKMYASGAGEVTARHETLQESKLS
jgi:hypothetical protein